MSKLILSIAAAIVLTSSAVVAATSHVRPTSTTYQGEIKIVDCTTVGFNTSSCNGTGIPSPSEWTAFQNYSNNLAQSGGYAFFGNLQDCDASSCGALKFIFEVP